MERQRTVRRSSQYDPPMRAIGGRRRHLCLVLAVLAGAIVAIGCGSSDDTSPEVDKTFDAEAINVSVGEELTLIDAFRAGTPFLRRPQVRALVRQFAGQEQEHLDGLMKLLRGLGGELEGEAAELDLSSVKTERDFLLLAYELTSSALTNYLEAVPHLTTPAPQALSASIAASQAQHLVALRQVLGAGLLDSVPEAFDTGEVPPPDGTGPSPPD
jgi:rubrerythrin